MESKNYVIKLITNIVILLRFVWNHEGQAGQSVKAHSNVSMPH